MKNNNLIILGVCIVVIGLALLLYSILSFAEINALSNKIDFDELENNNKIPTQQKYYKHISISEYLNIILNKNKNLPLKNTSCAYLDYAQHNTVLMYKLVFKGAHEDLSKRDEVEENIKYMQEILTNYKMCKNASNYKKELENIQDEIKKNDDLKYDKKLIMDTFLNSPGDIEQAEMLEPEVKQSNPVLLKDETHDNQGKAQDIYENAPIVEKNEVQ